MAKSSFGGFALFNYVLDTKKGYELMRNNLCGESPMEIMQEMKIVQDLNQRATKKLFSMVLSPHINEGKNLTKKELQNLTIEYLKELDLDPTKSQYIAFCHTEKEHIHCHILLNRVQNNKLLKDHHIGKKAQWAAHRVALNNNLISAKQMRIDKINNAKTFEKDEKNLRKEIYLKHLESLKEKPKSLEHYLEIMRRKGIEFVPTFNRKGDLQGFRLRDMHTQIDFKASDVHRSMGLKSLLEIGLPLENASVHLHEPLLGSQQIGLKVRAEEFMICEDKAFQKIEQKNNSQSLTTELFESLRKSANSTDNEENAPKRKFKRR